MSLPDQTTSETCLPVISSDQSLYEYNCTINQSAFSLINQHVLLRTKRSASTQYFYRELPIVITTRSQSDIKLLITFPCLALLSLNLSLIVSSSSSITSSFNEIILRF